MEKTSIKIPDAAGNYILVETLAGLRGYKTVSIYLAAERRKRKMGTINIAMKTISIDRKRGKHLHRSSQSYGFCHKLLSEGRLFTHVHLTDEHGTFLIPVRKILDSGKFLFFKQQGFERQIFFPVASMEEYRINNLI
jgi:hypothetical protein